MPGIDFQTISAPDVGSTPDQAQLLHDSPCS
jgi:hypothetical protein